MKPIITKEKSFWVFDFEFHMKMKLEPIRGKSFCGFLLEMYLTPTLIKSEENLFGFIK